MQGSSRIWIEKKNENKIWNQLSEIYSICIGSMDILNAMNNILFIEHFCRRWNQNVKSKSKLKTQKYCEK